MNSRVFVLAALFLSGCGDDGLGGLDGGPRPVPDAGDASMDAGDASMEGDGASLDAGRRPRCSLGGTGESHYYVIDTLDVAGPRTGAPDVVPGFNLDGLVSDGFDAEGCFQPDFASGSPDNLMGVDSQVGKLLLTLGFDDDLTHDFRTIVQGGSLIVFLAVHGVDDMSNDDCVHVELLVGDLVSPGTPPNVNASGRFESGQSFRNTPPARLADTETQALFGSGSIESGRVVASGGEVFDVGLPLDGSRSFLIRERELQIAFDITEAELSTGVIGARTPIEETIEINTEAFDGFLLSATQTRALLLSAADLEVTEQGCQSISMSHVFQAVAATPVP